MPRVTGQKTRQVIVVEPDGPLDPMLLPEHMSLFDEAGQPFVGGGGEAGNPDAYSAFFNQADTDLIIPKYDMGTHPVDSPVINVPHDAPIGIGTHLILEIFLQHNQMWNIIAELVAPDGTHFRFQNRNGSDVHLGSASQRARVHRWGTLSLADDDRSAIGDFKPDGNDWSGLHNKSTQGDWYITVWSHSTTVEGVLQSWGLRFVALDAPGEAGPLLPEEAYEWREAGVAQAPIHGSLFLRSKVQPVSVSLWYSSDWPNDSWVRTPESPTDRTLVLQPDGYTLKPGTDGRTSWLNQRGDGRHFYQDELSISLPFKILTAVAALERWEVGIGINFTDDTRMYVSADHQGRLRIFQPDENGMLGSIEADDNFNSAPNLGVQKLHLLRTRDGEVRATWWTADAADPTDLELSNPLVQLFLSPWSSSEKFLGALSHLPYRFFVMVDSVGGDVALYGSDTAAIEVDAANQLLRYGKELWFRSQAEDGNIGPHNFVAGAAPVPRQDFDSPYLAPDYVVQLNMMRNGGLIHAFGSDQTLPGSISAGVPILLGYLPTRWWPRGDQLFYVPYVGTAHVGAGEKWKIAERDGRITRTPDVTLTAPVKVSPQLIYPSVLVPPRTSNWF